MTDLISKRQMVEKINDLFLDKYEVKANSDLTEFYKEVLKILINEKGQSNWISVKNRLPDRLFEDVLTYDGREIRINWLEELIDDTFYFAYGESITHWMPLPELPKE